MEGGGLPHMPACWVLGLAGFEGWVGGVGGFLDDWSILARQLAIDGQPLGAGRCDRCWVERARRAQSSCWSVCEGSLSCCVSTVLVSPLAFRG